MTGTYLEPGKIICDAIIYTGDVIQHIGIKVAKVKEPLRPVFQPGGVKGGLIVLFSLSSFTQFKLSRII